MKIIARIYTDYKEKFGIPRQSGLVKSRGRIVFQPEYRNDEALRGLSEYSHIWLIWCFSEAMRDEWSPTVRPPRLGGNKRVGVFATRSPYRPNPIGLSSVRLLGIEKTKNEGTVLLVEGADILDGTPIYDIKPYLPYADSHPDAIGGFSDKALGYSLEVMIPEEIAAGIPKEELEDITELLSEDPRPSYKADGEREYGMLYGTREIHFTVENGIARITKISKIKLT